MFKKFLLILLCLGCIGCTSKTLTFNVSTQDQVEIQIKGNYQLTNEQGNFILEHDNKQKAQGMFIPKETYQALLKEKENILILEEGKKDGNPYFLTQSNEDYVYILFLENSQTGIYLTCTGSKQEAKDIFSSFTFKITENS